MTALRAGDALEPLVVDVEPGPMKTMAVLLRDPNPIHWDVAATRRLGLGDRPINQGPMNLAYLAAVAVRAAGGVEHLRGLSVRFLGNVVAGDRVTCGGRVASVDDAAGAADLELTAEVDGRPVLAGTARIALPGPTSAGAGAAR